LFWVYSYYGGFYRDNPWIVIVDIYYWTLLGPTLLVYIELLTKGREYLNWKYFLLLIPSLIVTIGFAEYIFIDGSLLFADRPPQNLVENISFFIWFYNAPLFYIFIIVQLFRHNRRVKHYYSNLKNVNLKWLTFLTYGFIFFLVMILFKSFFSNLLNIEYPLSLHYTWPVFVVYIFGIGFFGYKQQGIFSQTQLAEDADIKDNINILELNSLKLNSANKSYRKSGLSDEDIEELSDRLVKVMDTEMLYLDSELSLVSLSRKLNTTTHKLSQVINSKFGRNFFDFVNDYRIEEVKNRLNDPENNKFKIISIAYDCGFNSKSTFYTLFKKNTSLTPAEHRKRYQKQAV